MYNDVLQTVPGLPCEMTRPPILVAYDSEESEAKVFFRPKSVDVDVDAMRDSLNGLVYSDSCTGYDITRLIHGDIRLYFNPTYHDAGDRRRATRKVVDMICKTSYAEEDE